MVWAELYRKSVGFLHFSAFLDSAQDTDDFENYTFLWFLMVLGECSFESERSEVYGSNPSAARRVIWAESYRKSVEFLHFSAFLDSA